MSPILTTLSPGWYAAMKAVRMAPNKAPKAALCRVVFWLLLMAEPPRAEFFLILR